MTAAAMIRGQYFDLLPPPVPTLRDLVIRAVAAEAEYHRLSDTASDSEYADVDDAMFDARADLRAALMNLGLDKGLIDQLGGLL